MSSSARKNLESVQNSKLLWSVHNVVRSLRHWGSNPFGCRRQQVTKHSKRFMPSTRRSNDSTVSAQLPPRKLAERTPSCVPTCGFVRTTTRNSKSSLAAFYAPWGIQEGPCRSRSSQKLHNGRGSPCTTSMTFLTQQDPSSTRKTDEFILERS